MTLTTIDEASKIFAFGGDVDENTDDVVEGDGLELPEDEELKKDKDEDEDGEIKEEDEFEPDDEGEPEEE
ncbi:MAG: hypothetical protein NT058_00135 [Candidatus Portnoybacteria bacterium]|nr:hypothetical protein [Candidatus Portnoybacteria bacterium]